jgi:hypothetical protein
LLSHPVFSIEEISHAMVQAYLLILKNKILTYCKKKKGSGTNEGHFFRHLGIFSFLMLTGISMGCLDDIKVDLPVNSSDRLVIGGVAERSPDVYRFLITVSRTRDLSERVFPLENDVNISLLYHGDEVLSLTNGSPLIIPVEQFHSIYGGNPEASVFNIRVHTSDGQIYESREQAILQPPEGARISVSYDERTVLNDIGNSVIGDFVKIRINTPVVNPDDQRISLIWKVSGVFKFLEGECTTDPYGSPRLCYVQEFHTQSPSSVLNGAKVHGDQVEDFEIMETTADARFALGYYFTVVQRTLNNEAGIYWEQAKESITREGTIFDSSPGALPSNIIQKEGAYSEVLGYFYTAGIDTIRYYASQNETGNQRLACARDPQADGCCECFRLSNSSLVKPVYWDE